MYEFGMVQLNNQTYTFNRPHADTNTLRTSGVAPFLVYRIHVDHDWDGSRLLEIMENGLEKPLPFEDDFASNNGWISSWGSVEIGRNNFVLTAVPESTGAATFLDGAMFWDNYSFDVSANWVAGAASVLADVVDANTYHACVFTPGAVRIQKTVRGETELLKEVRNPRITHGASQIGIRVHDSVIECTWNFESIGEVYSRDFTGGVGIQTWNEVPGTASLQVSSVIARPL